MKLSEIEKALFVVNLSIVQHNIRRMIQKAERHNLLFRPHVKTHQSKEVAAIMKAEGIHKITVSSMDMCLNFIDMGFQDICIAIPFNLNEIHRLNSIPETIKIQICLDSHEVFNALDISLTRQVYFYIKTDAGYGRSGLPTNRSSDFNQLIQAAQSSKHLNFYGLLVHNGQMYHAKNIIEIHQLHNESLKQLIDLAAKLTDNVFLSIGDTPAISITENFKGIHEIRPGNFVYYDLMQEHLGVCKPEEIAVRLFAPVIGKYPERNELVVHAGAVHLSKEAIIINEKNCYGQVVAIHTKKGRKMLPERLNIIRLSQEHGIIYADAQMQSHINYGDFLEIIPVHSCLTANLMLTNTFYTK
ncbi:MAG: alanine racemase [Bacteroidota bacterium]|nr:alanine racemase [Bacteroidota bacterium]